MDINFNGTIITLFGSLPLKMLGSQGGAGLGPSAWMFSVAKSAALAVGMCHSAEGGEKGVMETGGKRRFTPPTLPCI